MNALNSGAMRVSSSPLRTMKHHETAWNTPRAKKANKVEPSCFFHLYTKKTHTYRFDQVDQTCRTYPRLGPKQWPTCTHMPYDHVDSLSTLVNGKDKQQNHSLLRDCKAFTKSIAWGSHSCSLVYTPKWRCAAQKRPCRALPPRSHWPSPSSRHLDWCLAWKQKDEFVKIDFCSIWITTTAPKVDYVMCNVSLWCCFAHSRVSTKQKIGRCHES